MQDTAPELPVDVRDSGVHGLGAFARRAMPAGTAIGTYTGRRYAPHEHAERDWDHALTYVFALSDGTIIDGSEGGNFTRHINHSCTPNCAAYEIVDDDGVAQIVIEAKRRIRAGEELFIDYSLDVGDNDPDDYACHCGTARCRGTLVAA